MIIYSILSSFGWIPFIVIIWMLVSVRGRVKRLEKEVGELRGGSPVTKQAYVPAQAQIAEQWAVPGQAVAPTPAYTVERTQTPQVSQEPGEPSWDEAFGAWVKEDWLLKLGGFIVLLAFGWFINYSFGPVGRIVVGIIAGISILGFGTWRMNAYARQGAIFLALGDAVILLTIFVARSVYKDQEFLQLLTPEIALSIMFLATAFVALLSVKYRNKSLSILSLVLAAIVPILSQAPSSNHVGLYAYLFIVVLGVVWVVGITGWRELTAVALVLVAFYNITDFAQTSSLVDLGSLLWFGYAFAIVFFVTNTIGILKIQEGDIQADIVTAAGNGLLLLTWINVGASIEWKSLIMVGWMIVFTIAAFAVFAVTKRREPFFVYAGVGIAMLAAATAIDFHGAGLTIAYTLESAIISLVVYAVTHDRNIAKKLTLLVIGPCVLALGSIAANWQASIPGDHFFVLLILSASLLLLGVFFMSLRQEGEEDNTAPALFIGGSVYAYVLLWLSLHATSVIQDGDTATMVCLVIYTIIGLIAYAYGRMRENKSVHYYGSTLLAFTIGHLLLVDVRHMAISGRIVTFFVVGALVMGTAFMSKKKHPAIPQA